VYKENKAGFFFKKNGFPISTNMTRHDTTRNIKELQNSLFLVESCTPGSTLYLVLLAAVTAVAL
jgi:hypothetical protein